MRVRLSCFAGLFLAVALTTALAQTQRWVLYTHPDKLMSVRFPSKPIESEQEAPSAVGNIRVKIAMLVDGVHIYSATAIVYPVNTEFDMERGRDQALAAYHGKATSEKPITLDGFVGREVWFDAIGPKQDPRHGIMRMFFSPKPPTAFMATAMWKNDKPDADSQRFLASMHLGKKTETREP